MHVISLDLLLLRFFSQSLDLSFNFHQLFLVLFDGVDVSSHRSDVVGESGLRGRGRKRLQDVLFNFGLKLFDVLFRVDFALCPEFEKVSN